MIRKNLFVLALSVFSVVTFTSCMDFTKKNSGVDKLYINSVGDVLLHEGGEKFDIILDNCDTVRIANTDQINNKKAKSGDRFFFKALITGELEPNPFKVYLAEFENQYQMPVMIYKPHTLEYINEEQDRIDSIGNDDLLIIDNPTVSGKYLNVTYKIRFNDTKIPHTLSFVIDESKSDDAILHVTMHHNLNGDDVANITNNVLASCKIEDYLEADEDGKLTVELHYREGEYSQKKKEVKWLRPSSELVP